MTATKALDTQINYAGMLWLLAAQVAVMLPFLLHLPFWLVSVLLLSNAWRIRVLRGHWAQPRFMIKIVAIIVGVTALVVSGPNPLSLDMMSSLLLLAFAFKSLEVIHRRDAAVVVFTGYFLVSVQFLYSQSIGAALYGVICLTLLTAALIAAQQNTQKKISDHLKIAGAMLLQCLPLMIILYLFFPRLPPLWAVSLPSDRASSGISDSMAPGDIANLSQSDDPAFRVSFKGSRPRQNQLYWRGLTLHHFDGVTWQQFSEPLSDDALKQTLHVEREKLAAKDITASRPISYEIIYEPTQKNWLFTLSPVTNWQGEAFLGFDYRLMANQALYAPFVLKASSDLGGARNFQPNNAVRDLSLQFPSGQNPRAHALARQWRAQAKNDLEYAQNVMQYFREQSFYYTLRPPTAGRADTIDNFLFESQRGFCSHYAGSFVFLMRAAGIPARVVLGYQGGEWNSEEAYLTVHQYDAHAWTEIWLDEKGWVRFDPTAMVAPDRIEKNLQAAVKEEGSFLERNRFSVRHFQWLNGLRKKWDAMQYGWRRWVLGYDNTRQTDLLKKWLGEITTKRIALVFGGLFAAIVTLWMLMLGFIRFKSDTSPAIKTYRALCRKLEKRGLKRPAALTPNQYAKLAAERFPKNAAWILEATKLFEQINYGIFLPEQQSSLLKQFKQAVKRA